MIRKNWLRTCGRVASVVAFVLLFTIALLGNGVQAQSAQSANGGTVLKPASPPAFLVAPSMPLGYSPTSMAAGMLTSSGRVDLVTADPGAGKITVFTGLGHGTFAPGNTYAAGAQPVSLVVADINGDGKADVLLANPSDGVISLFAGNGDGTLGARTTFAVGFAPSLIAVGDFTGNGKLDVAVAGSATKTLAILANDGTGNLKRPVNFSLHSLPAAIIAADFNHDGQMDLATANSDGTVSILLGKGNGQFSVPADVSVASGPLTSIAAADFNRDGNTDLVVTASAVSQAAVLLGHGDGSFAPAGWLQVGDSPVAAHVADVDGDGIPDLIIINKGSNTFSVLNGVGDGTFKEAVHFVVGNAPLGGAAADLYGSGHLDFATINQLGQTLSVPAGNGDGTFAAGRAYVAGAQPVAVAAGDLTASGKTDLVVGSYCGADATCGGNGSAAVLLAVPGGIYQLASTYTMGAGSVAIHLFDMNGDGKADLVALNRVDKSVSIRLGAGDGTFGNLITIPLAGAPVALAAADFNQDGKTDLAVLSDCGSASCTQPGEVEFLLGSGDGTFHNVSSYPVGYAPVALAAGKTSVGGNIDVLVANRCGSDASCKSAGTATVLLGDGTGAFKAGTDVALGNSPSSIALADLRGAGIQDLVVSRSTDNTVAVLPGDGKGSFGAAVPYPVGHAPGKLVVADFNGDGQPDVAVANTADSTVSVLFGQKGGTLQTAFAVPVAGNPSALAAVAGATNSAPASLATTNGSMGAPTAAPNVTVLANLGAHPLVTGTNPPDIPISFGPSSPNPSNVNQGITVTASVTVVGTNTPTANLTIQATLNGGSPTPVVLCTGPSPLTCTNFGGLTAGTWTIEGSYPGDNFYASGTSASPLSQPVNAAPTTLTITPATATGTVNTSTSFTATLGGTFTPTAPSTTAGTAGTITFSYTDSHGTTTNLGDCTDIVLTSLAANSYGANCNTMSVPAGTYTINASYSGETNFAKSSTTTPSNDTVAKASVTIDVQGPASSTVNTQVTLTARLVGTFSPTPPGGTISFVANATTKPIALCTNVNVTSQGGGAYGANCQTSALVAPNDQVTATYSGDTNFNLQNASNTLTTAVAPQASTITVVLPGTHPVTNETFNIQAQVTPNPAGSGTPAVIPSGTVSISVNGSVVCGTAGLSATYPPTASCSYTSSAGIPSPGQSVLVTYAGDNDFNAAPNGNGSLIVDPASTSVKLNSPADTTVNTTVNMTATLTPAFTGKGIPAGSVTFSVTPIAPATSTNIGGSCVAAGGVAVASDGTVPLCTLAYGAVGSYSIKATFTSKDGNFQNSPASPAVTQNVGVGSAGIVVSSSNNSSFVNDPVTLSVQFNPSLAGSQSQPSGSLEYDDTFNGTTTVLCGPTNFTSGNLPQCPFTFVKAGGHSIVAHFKDTDGSFSSADASPITQTVQASPTTTSAPSVSPAPHVNQTLTFSATITPTHTGNAVPTGTVTFTYTNSTMTQPQTICGAPQQVSKSGTNAVATCTDALPTADAYVITATYSGDNDFSKGNPAVTNPAITVSATDTTATLTSAPTTGPSPISANEPVTLSAAVTAQYAGVTKPAGAVTFTDTTTNVTLCPNVPLSGGSATCPYTFVTARAGDNIQAVFAPSDNNFNAPKTVPALNQPVAADPTSLNVTSSLPMSIATQSVTFTATLTPTFPVQTGPNPAGSITLQVTQGTTSLACAATALAPAQTPPTSYVSTCALAFPPNVGGNFTVSASYIPNGDGNFGGSSNQSPQVVENFGSTFAAPTSGSLQLTQNVGNGAQDNTTDPFTPQTISVAVSPIGGLTGKLDITCTVLDANGNAVSDPAATSCPSTVTAAPNLSFPVTLSASAQAPVGAYTLQVKATDDALNTLQQVTSLNVYVIGVSGTLTLAQISTGTTSVVFDTAKAAAGATLGTFTCKDIKPTPLTGTIACSGSGTPTGSGGSTTVPITVTLSAGTGASAAQKSSGLYAASMIGLPLLALLGWIGSRRSPRRNFFRIVGLLLLAMGLSSYLTACGGGFNHPQTNGGGVTPGSYLIQVEATDSNNNSYTAVVPLVVN